MADKTSIKIKNMSNSQSKKWKELIEGNTTDTRSVDDNPVIAQNLQSYENYLNKNTVTKKKKR
jgi:hypothetical protein